MKTFLRSKTWAKKYESCYPQGNGKIGIMDNLAPVKSVIWLNDETLWSGTFSNIKPKTNTCKEEEIAKKRAILTKIRSALEESNFKEAEKIVKEEIAGNECESYIPIGKITIEKGWGFPTNYERELDIDRSVLTCHYVLNEKEYSEVSFVSNPDNVFVKRISCNKASIFRIRLFSEHRLNFSFENNILYAFGYAPSHIVYDGLPSIKPIIYDEKADCIKFVLAIKIDSDAKYIYYSDDSVRIVNATYLNLYYTSITNYKDLINQGFQNTNQTKPSDNMTVLLRETVTNIVNNAFQKTYIGCLNSHIDDYTRIYNRVLFEINGVSASPSNLVKSLKEIQKTGADLDSLIVTLYNFNRYLLISASRENSLLPSNLQGIWSKANRPRWSSGYTLNINLQMNYWGALNSNLFECIKPFIEFVKRIAILGEDTAREIFGCNGFVLGHNSDAWFHSSPVGGETSKSSSSYSLSIATSAWLINQLFDIYRFTLDEKFLKEDLIPLMEKCLAFFVDYLYLDKDGKYCTGPDISPENSYIFSGEKFSIDKAPTLTLAVIRELMKNYLASIKPETGVYDQVKYILDNMQGYKINSDGRIAEWSSEYQEAEIKHRHLSHLYGIYPGSDLLKDDNLRVAAKKSLDTRGEEGTGWSLAWKICMYARMKDGETALKLLKKQFSPVRNKYGQKGGSYLSLLSAHPPFQIDGNLGTLAGINEMLVQSHGEKIEFLPAIPSLWKDGHIRGLRVRGNKVVDIEWKDGQIVSSNISALK